MMNDKRERKKNNGDFIVGILIEKLIHRFGLKQSFSVDKFKGIDNENQGNKVERVFITKNSIDGSIRFADHYDPEADILINDSQLNTLGLIFVFSENMINEKKAQSFPEFIENCIDKAVYIRHLFLRRADTKTNFHNRSDKILARSVELVILCPDAFKKKFGNILKKIVQDTDYLYSVGVNLLTFQDELEPDSSIKKTHPNNIQEEYFLDKELDRAFSWLLTKTRKWYVNAKFNHKSFLEKIILKNFRLPGERVLHLATKTNPTTNIHLVHGPNGSGKSSIAEALELVVTGKLEHLEKIKDRDYVQIIRNQSSKGAAVVELADVEENINRFKIIQTGISGLEPLAKNLNATSFRLNQAVMERLTRAGEGERANIFIDAFFPEDREAVEGYNKFRIKADENFEKLPQTLKEKIIKRNINREDAAIECLSPLENKNEKMPLELIEACLPVPLRSMDKLIPLVDEAATALNILKSGQVTEAVCRKVDGALKQVRKQIHFTLSNLREALDLFKMLNKWQASGQYAPDFKTTLDKWMEMTALTDLTEKTYTVVKSLKNAESQNLKMDDDTHILAPFLPALDDKFIAKKIEMFTKERDELRTLLEPHDNLEEKEGAPLSIKPSFDHHEEDRLNRVGKWLSFLNLGSTIKEAVSTNKRRVNKSITIGEQNWAAGLIRKTEELIAACHQIKDQEGFNSRERFIQLKDTLQTYKDLKEMSSKIHETFVERLKKEKEGNLIEVLNEVIDLFTPARWAYEDISIQHEFSGDKHKLHFEIGETEMGRGERIRADLRLNTAELNIFALALFVLCSVRVDNPLSLLIFDDPLQNMDEITVTALARGLNKLIKLFPGNWQILMLFHGREDLERFCREVPAAVYFLPWLSPALEKEEKPITIEHDVIKSRLFARGQDLSDIISISE